MISILHTISWCQQIQSNILEPSQCLPRSASLQHRYRGSVSPRSLLQIDLSPAPKLFVDHHPIRIQARNMSPAASSYKSLHHSLWCMQRPRLSCNLLSHHLPWGKTQHKRHCEKYMLDQHSSSLWCKDMDTTHRTANHQHRWKQQQHEYLP